MRSVSGTARSVSVPASLRPGTRALIEGPYGRLTSESYTGGPVVLLACGIGVTPLLSLLGDLPYSPGGATLIYRARTEADLRAGNFRCGVERAPLIGR